MIGLRIAHLLSSLHASAATSTALNSMRWLRRNGHETVAIATGGERAGDFAAEGLDVMSYRTDLSWWFGGRRRLAEAIAAWMPDLLHVQRPECLRLGLGLAEDLRLPVVASLHHPIDERTAKPLRDPAVKVILVGSESLRAHCCHGLGLPKNRVAVLPYGLDLARYPIIERRSSLRTIGAIGNAAEDGDGFATVLEAIQRLRSEGRDVAGVLVSAKEAQPRLEREIRRLGLGSQVRLAVGCSRVVPHLQDMDIFAYPVTRDQCLILLIKAMATACPVVAPATGGVPEVIRDGVSGILVPVSDPEALARALARLLDDPALARSLGIQARRSVEERHSLLVFGEAIHALYRLALSSSSTQDVPDTVRIYRRPTTAMGEDSRGGSGSRPSTGTDTKP